MSVVNERPILMSGPLVIATLAGRKTQTRRVITAQPPPEYTHCEVVDPWCHFYDDLGPPNERGNRDGKMSTVKCPYGARGDRLWVREAWNVRGLAWGMKPRDAARIAASKAWVYRAGDESGWQHGWKPGIHMPRRASRLTLEITEIRVQRVQNISEDDARAEGVDTLHTQTGPLAIVGRPWASEFARLWDSINGKRLVGGKPITWAANPWVWAISYRVVPS